MEKIKEHKCIIMVYEWVLISFHNISMLWAGPNPKRLEMEKRKGHLISLYNIFIIYQYIAIIHLLVSQAIVEHKLLY